MVNVMYMNNQCWIVNPGFCIQLFWFSHNHLFYIITDAHVYATPENCSSEKKCLHCFQLHISPYLLEIGLRMNIAGVGVGWWGSTAL